MNIEQYQATGFRKRRDGASAFKLNFWWIWVNLRFDERRVKGLRWGGIYDSRSIEGYLIISLGRNRAWETVKRKDGGVIVDLTRGNLYKAL